MALRVPLPRNRLHELIEPHPPLGAAISDALHAYIHAQLGSRSEVFQFTKSAAFWA
jgi:hypothetical protein